MDFKDFGLVLKEIQSQILQFAGPPECLTRGPESDMVMLKI